VPRKRSGRKRRELSSGTNRAGSESEAGKGEEWFERAFPVRAVVNELPTRRGSVAPSCVQANSDCQVRLRRVRKIIVRTFEVMDREVAILRAIGSKVPDRLVRTPKSGKNAACQSAENTHLARSAEVARRRSRSYFQRPPVSEVAAVRWRRFAPTHRCARFEWPPPREWPATWRGGSVLR
jgi:hypothetical protein